ncbi:MAG TPA: nuclear transport factor 2 family protein [Actinomycetota bacterium]|nr:nuclear transport factor 2 family protein [Actinomycetota bacterium]
MDLTRAVVEAWLERYVRAWDSNDPADITALFTDDARYFTAPHRDPWVGPDTIAAKWIRRKDEPGTWTFRSEILGVDGDLAFVRGWTTYMNDPDYSNLWVIRLDGNGKCSEFTEWWMEVDK